MSKGQGCRGQSRPGRASHARLRSRALPVAGFWGARSQLTLKGRQGSMGRKGREDSRLFPHPRLSSLEEPQPFARALSTGACSARSVLFPNKRSWGQGWGGVFVVCLLEPVAAPGLTFKASNAAFQAAPAGGHGCGGKLLRLKCHVGLETCRGAGASPHLRAARAPSCPPSDTAVLSEAGGPQRNAGAGLRGVCRGGPSSPAPMSGMFLFTRTRRTA